LNIYHYAYRARLIEALGSDFPTLQAMVGAARFVEMVRGCIAAYPSPHYSA
jgi:Putative DNA-binding domain